MESRDSLTGLNAFTAVAARRCRNIRCMPALHDAAEILLDAMMADDFAHWGPLYVRWEAGLLDALGFGLDLSQCAATGRDGRSDLCFAAHRAGGVAKARARTMPRGCWRCRSSCWAASPAPDLAATRAGLKLTGHFLLERVLAPHGREMPQAQIARSDASGGLTRIGLEPPGHGRRR